MSTPLLTRKSWSWALHNAAAMALHYSHEAVGRPRVDNDHTPEGPCRSNARPSGPGGSACSPEILGVTALPVGTTVQHYSAIRTQHVHPTRGLSTLIFSSSPCRRDRRFVAIGRVMIVGLR